MTHNAFHRPSSLDDTFPLEDLADSVVVGFQIAFGKANLLDTENIGKLLTSFFKQDNSPLEPRGIPVSGSSRDTIPNS